MAWIEKRTKGYLVRWREPSGKTTSRTRRTLDEARALKAEMESQIHRGVYVAVETRKLPFREYATQVLDADNLEATTRYNYDLTLNTHLRTICDRPIETIDAGVVRALFGRMKSEGATPSVLNMTKKTISKICGVAVEDGILPRNPARAVKVPKVERRQVKPLTPEEVATVAEAVPPRWRSAVLLAAWGGLSISEVGALTVDDIDWERGSVSINKSQSHLGVKAPKTKNRYRHVTMPKFVMTELRKHVLEYADPQGRLFTTTRGNPINHMTIAPIMRKTGVKFHDLRHTAVAILIKRGADPLAIKERMGHSSITVTYDVYGHLFEGTHDELARKLDQFDPGEMGEVIEL